ncbi:unnamed protein product [Durusdinium trenchii]|uniref:Uncharacterized protein n=1 Tax=Durusdinium trenchii TaxID=1381693 RepID=A0ABP0MC79_9DINO
MERDRPTRWGRIFGSFFPMAPRAPVRAEEVPPPEAPRPEEKKPEEEAAVQFEMMQREWQNISMQDNWDGFRIEAQNKVTETLQATHSIFLGTRLRECGYLYHFGSVFQSPDQRTVLLARAGLDGGVNGRIIQKLGSCWEVKASSNSDLKDVGRNMHESSLEYTGPERALCGKLAWQGAWVGGGSFVQKILPQLQMGGRSHLGRGEWCDLHRSGGLAVWRRQEHPDGHIEPYPTLRTSRSGGSSARAQDVLCAKGHRAFEPGHRVQVFLSRQGLRPELGL